MTAAPLSSRAADLEAAWRHSAVLKAAIAAGKHDCWCGVFGAFRMTAGGPWFCQSHVEKGEDGLMRAVEGIEAREVAA